MKSWCGFLKNQQRLLLGVSVFCLLVVGFTVALYKLRETIKLNGCRVKTAMNQLVAMENLESLIIDSGVNSRGYLITRDKNFLIDLKKSRHNYKSKMSFLRKNAGSGDLPYLDRVDAAWLEQMKMLDEILPPLRSSALVFDKAMHRWNLEAFSGRRALHHEVARLVQHLEEEVSAAQNASGASDRLYLTRVTFTLEAGFVLLFAFSYLVFRMLKREAEAREAAVQANRTKSAFVANISHEIRTPLAAILGHADLLYEHQKISDPLRSLSTIKRNGEQLIRLIDDLLDLSKVESGYLELELVNFDLPELLLDIRELLSPKALEKGIFLNMMMRGQIPRQVNTDPNRLKQILLNLVSNALKFTSKGGVSVSVEWDETKTLRFFVKDSGIGIDWNEKKKIFFPFTQADNSTARRFGGTGLGLAVSQRLAKLLNGELILLDSVKGQGSTFALSIPCEIIEPVVLVDKLDATKKCLSVVPQGLQNSLLEGLQILLVEDSLDNQFIVSRYLSGAGATVVTASDGQEALDKSLEHPHDVVVMDIQMPVMDGYQVAKLLRQRGDTAPLVALTAHAMKEEKLRSFAAGFQAHLTKPVERRILIETIASLVKNRRSDKAKSFLDAALTIESLQ